MYIYLFKKFLMLMFMFVLKKIEISSSHFTHKNTNVICRHSKIKKGLKNRLVCHMLSFVNHAQTAKKWTPTFFQILHSFSNNFELSKISMRRNLIKQILV